MKRLSRLGAQARAGVYVYVCAYVRDRDKDRKKETQTDRQRQKTEFYRCHEAKRQCWDGEGEKGGIEINAMCSYIKYSKRLPKKEVKVD